MTTPQQALHAALDWFEAKENCRDHQEVERMIREALSAIPSETCKHCGLPIEMDGLSWIHSGENRFFACELANELPNTHRNLFAAPAPRTEFDGRQLPSPSPVFDVAANEGVSRG